jgi:hypothetical protein
MKCLPLELSEEWGFTCVRVYVSVLIQFILLIWNVSYVSYTTKYTKQLSYGTMAQNRYHPDKDTGNPEAAEKLRNWPTHTASSQILRSGGSTMLPDLMYVTSPRFYS